jgi:hypothetical protein
MITTKEKAAIDLFESYITAWNHRETGMLELMFDRDIFLEDWEVSVCGKESVIGANAQIWESVPDIHIKIKETFYCERKNTVTAKLRVFSNKENIDLDVVDIVTIVGKRITKVEAYKK